MARIELDADKLVGNLTLVVKIDNCRRRCFLMRVGLVFVRLGVWIAGLQWSERVACDGWAIGQHVCDRARLRDSDTGGKDG